jgi:hypothetical protein
LKLTGYKLYKIGKNKGTKGASWKVNVDRSWGEKIFFKGREKIWISDRKITDERIRKGFLMT